MNNIGKFKNYDIRELEQRLPVRKSSQPKNLEVKKDFNKILSSINSDYSLKFSKHAKTRMESRKINLDNSEMIKLKRAFSKAEEKGIQEALIIIEDKAFIGSIKNKTVITAVNRNKLEEEVFTNIDGAVIL